MTRKRFIKLMMATGAFDRNKATDYCEVLPKITKKYSYASLFESYNDLWENEAAIDFAAGYFRKETLYGLIAACKCCDQVYCDLNQTLSGAPVKEG